MTETIALHYVTTPTGRKVPYARVIRVFGNRIHGQSIALHRLSKSQLGKLGLTNRLIG